MEIAQNVQNKNKLQFKMFHNYKISAFWDTLFFHKHRDFLVEPHHT